MLSSGHFGLEATEQADQMSLTKALTPRWTMKLKLLKLRRVHHGICVDGAADQKKRQEDWAFNPVQSRSLAECQPPQPCEVGNKPATSELYMLVCPLVERISFKSLSVEYVCSD